MFLIHEIVLHGLLLPDISDGPDFSGGHLGDDADKDGLCFWVFDFYSELFGECSAADLIISIDLFFEYVEGVFKFKTFQKFLNKVEA